MRRYIAVTLLAVTACAARDGQPPLTAKDTLKLVDAGVQQACMGLAQSLAARAGADADKVIRATCAAEGFTRSLREMLLSQQIEAAKAAGVVVPDINSGHLEDEALAPSMAAE